MEQDLHYIYIYTFFGNQFFVPVNCHNMKGYDSLHILKHLSPIFEENPDEFAEIHEIDVIASNTEKYNGFQMGALRFLDSYNFSTPVPT